MDDAQLIRTRIDTWFTAFKEGDVDVLAGILGDDMQFVVPSRPPFGKREFLAGLTGKPYRFDATVDVTELAVHGAWARTCIHLAIEFAATADAEPIRLAGPTTSIWRKSAEGRWVVWRDENMLAVTETATELPSDQTMVLDDTGKVSVLRAKP